MADDLNEAWKIVEEMYQRGFGFCIERAHDAPSWTVHFVPNLPKHKGEEAFMHFVEEMEKISASSKSLPEAIARAAQRAKELCE